MPLIVIKLFKQQYSTSCWAACLAMIFCKLGKKDPIFKQDVIFSSNGSSSKTTGDLKEILKGYGVRSDQNSGQRTLNEQEIKIEIDADRPIMVGVLNSDRNEGHSLLVIGYETNPTFQLIIIDPKDKSQKQFATSLIRGNAQSRLTFEYDGLTWQDTIYGISR